jgi:hypothetical protein
MPVGALDIPRLPPEQPRQLISRHRPPTNPRGPSRCPPPCTIGGRLFRVRMLVGAAGFEPTTTSPPVFTLVFVGVRGCGFSARTGDLCGSRDRCRAPLLLPPLLPRDTFGGGSPAVELEGSSPRRSGASPSRPGGHGHLVPCPGCVTRQVIVCPGASHPAELSQHQTLPDDGAPGAVGTIGGGDPGRACDRSGPAGSVLRVHARGPCQND